jgi:hypothetical protein
VLVLVPRLTPLPLLVFTPQGLGLHALALLLLLMRARPRALALLLGAVCTRRRCFHIESVQWLANADLIAHTREYGSNEARPRRADVDGHLVRFDDRHDLLRSHARAHVTVEF